jgi:hypothetical protein
VLRLLGELSGYLASLGGALTYSRENYASPSGINMPELLRIRGLLLSQSESTDDQRQRTGRRARRLMHQGGDLVIGEGRQLIESGHPVLHARPVVAVQDTAHLLKVCHHRHRLRLRNTLAPSVERVERRRFERSRILASWAAARSLGTGGRPLG